MGCAAIMVCRGTFARAGEHRRVEMPRGQDMDESDQRSWSGLGWGVLAIIAVAALAALAYFALPGLHGARTEASYQRLVQFLTHSQPEKTPAAAVAEDRHMDPHFESDLRSFVPSSTRITITAVSGDPEALAFAQEIAAWLRANGWQYVQGVSDHKPREQERLMGTNLQINPKGGMELIVGPRP
jgi:hypothetical protein